MLPVHVAVERLGVRCALSAVRVETIARLVLRAEKVTAGLLSITFVDGRKIARINREHLGHHGPTDVISFAFVPTPGAGLVGDVYICPTVVAEHARQRSIGVREELARVVVHGTLHVVGWEHPDGDDAERIASPMWRRQEALLRRCRRVWRTASTGSA
jgi:probable rRNA maturation factor